MEMAQNCNKDYYMKPVKIIRDLVHGYINLTQFDLQLIDTIEFQRLKDIRQLTSQDVFPSARHTRFEHSLGVLELTRQAIKRLNQNGILNSQKKETAARLISEELEFNTALAALLHDVGHSPFSHLGELEFDKNDVAGELISCMGMYSATASTQATWANLMDKIQKNKNLGARHERLSCIVILTKFETCLSQVKEDQLPVNLEFIIRCILGIEYDVPSSSELCEYQVKNAMIRLINSNIFDMDKLDYIMRDSFYTGLSTPEIDTQRLFRNMYFYPDYTLVFTSKAVPTLQNMIESRDTLYLYVYNHHASVYSDFMHGYIMRRIAHNKKLVEDIIPWDNNALGMNSDDDGVQLALGASGDIFSVKAVVEQACSDSSWTSFLSRIHYYYASNKGSKELIKQQVVSYMHNIKGCQLTAAESTKIDKLADRAIHVHELVHNLLERDYLKPWWKTVYEFNTFIAHHFNDDQVRGLLQKYICKGGSHGLNPAEFRSQIAKHVRHITGQLVPEKLDDRKQNVNLVTALNDGDFFVIERSPRFFSSDTIEKINIALMNSEVIGTLSDIKTQSNDYYIKSLTNVIPQKNYSAIYAEEGFYIFSRKIQPKYLLTEKIAASNAEALEQISRHQKQVEDIFVSVANYLIGLGEQSFVETFQASEENPDKLKKNEDTSLKYALKCYTEDANIR